MPRFFVNNPPAAGDAVIIEGGDARHIAGALRMTAGERLTLCDGSVAQNPRANCPIWKCRNGHYLLWFHNHDRCEYGQRNPAWISAGKEIDTPEGKTLRWSMPAVLFYGKPEESISYPEFWETENGYFFSETQKRISRFHQIPREFMEELFDSI